MVAQSFTFLHSSAVSGSMKYFKTEVFHEILQIQIKHVFHISSYEALITCWVCALLLPVRVVIFAVVWVLSWGKLSFWLLPNLTEDVGFTDSFRPVYECTYASKVDSGEEDSASVGGDADKSGEAAEDSGGMEEKSEDHVEELEASGDFNEEDEEENAAEDGNGDEDAETSSADDIDEEEEEQSVGANDNGYEMVSAEDLDNGEAAENPEDADESRPTVRRRKGKRRIT